MIKAVIFDWGGVLIDNPTQGLIAYCVKSLGVREEAFRPLHKKYEPEFQRGEISEEIFWEKICSELKVQKPNTASLWGDALRHVYKQKEEIFSLASYLHNNGYKVGFLSNAEAPAMKFFQEQKYDMFDAEVFSCAEGARKPEKKIYIICLERLEVEANEAVFIDDKKENIDGARKAGLRTILFESPGQVKRELAAMGVKVE